MNLNPLWREERSAYSQLLLLSVFALIGTFIGSLISMLLLGMLYGAENLTNGTILFSGDPRYLTGLRIAQSLTTLLLFLMPAIVLAYLEKTKLNRFYGFKKPVLSVLLLILLVMACSMPLVELFAMLNQKMVLPDFLKPLEIWMREKEDAALKMTVLLLKIRGPGEFLVNILVVALLPAIAEELLFRGGVQRSFSKMFNNPHLAIWLAAFIFSAIHVQFFGFLPRLILGAVFGYIYLWTGSLWYAMFAHFLNNAYAICQAWYMQAHGIPLDQLENSTYFPWYGYVISLILSIFLFNYLSAIKQRGNGEQLG